MAHPFRHEPNKVFRGTLDEVLAHRGEIPTDATVELRVLEEPSKKGERSREGVIPEPQSPRD